VVSELKLVVTSWGSVLLDKREVKALMRAAGNDIRSQTARLLNKASGTGRVYRGMGGGKYRGGDPSGRGDRASSPGQPAVRVTNTLRGSLKTYVYPSGEGFAVRERAFYGLFLETGAHGGGPGTKRGRRAAQGQGQGTRVLEPRPALEAVMARSTAALNARVEKALRSGLKWKQTK
jgi:hypothetical protein